MDGGGGRAEDGSGVGEGGRPGGFESELEFGTVLSEEIVTCCYT